MSLLNTLKKAQLQARKARDTFTATLLTTLIGEAAMFGKNNGNRESTDDEVIYVIKKFVKNNMELIKLTDGNIDAENENDILTQYLPLQLTEKELVGIVQDRIKTLDEISPKLMGVMMNWLKNNYKGQYDGKLASKIVKNLLS